jgi:N-dimethylarginine dimethylaminohydrolase
MNRYGGQNMYGALKRVIVRRPDTSFANADPKKWHYASPPNLHSAKEEHDALVSIIRNNGTEIIYHDTDLPGLADAIYVFDPVLMTDQGAIILKMGKDLRRGEEEGILPVLEKFDIPVLGMLTGEAMAEGGDLLWVDRNTLAAGVGFRTNKSGISQLQDLLTPLSVDVIPVELPYYRGARACLHLLSLISIVDKKLAVVYPPLMSVPFWQYLSDLGFSFIEVPENEFLSMGPNVLALEPCRCVMLAGNPETKKRLENAGCEVFTYQGNEISLKAEGGPTCLTRPVLRLNE